MPCPHCAAPTTTQMARRTTLGYRMFGSVRFQYSQVWQPTVGRGRPSAP